MRPPSGANTALLTGSVWPRMASGLPSRSHSRAVLSREAARMRPPPTADDPCEDEAYRLWQIKQGSK